MAIILLRNECSIALSHISRNRGMPRAGCRAHHPRPFEGGKIRVHFLWQKEYALLRSLLGFLRVFLPGSVAMLFGDQKVLPGWDVCKRGRPYSSWDRSFFSLPREL